MKNKKKNKKNDELIDEIKEFARQQDAVDGIIELIKKYDAFIDDDISEEETLNSSEYIDLSSD